MESDRTETRDAAEILAFFTRNNLIHDRNAAHRAMREAVRVWPGPLPQMWSKWVAEAAQNLGLTTRTIDCSVDEVIRLARDGAKIISFGASAEPGEVGEWMALLGQAGRRFQVLLSETDIQKNVSQRELGRLVTRLAAGDILRCVVILPVETHPLTAAEDEDHPSPFKRLWMLLEPEFNDIWIVAVFAFVVSVLTLATPMAVEALVNTVAFGRFLQPIFVLSLILLTFLGFQGAIRALQFYVVEIIQRRLFARVAGDLAHRLPRTVVEATDGDHVPELVNRFFDIVGIQKVVSILLLDVLGLVLNTTIGMAVLAFYHPWLFGFDVFLLAAIGLIVFTLGRGAVKASIVESKHKYYTAGWLEEIARCPTIFRTDGGSEFALERGDRLIHEYLTARRFHFRILLRQILFSLGLQALASTVLLGLGGWLVVTGELTLGQLVAAELIVTVIVGSFAKIGKHLESFYDLLASIDKLGSLFDIPLERIDGMLGTGATGPATLRLDSLSYVYGKSSPALTDVSLEVAAGERLAIIGASGVGKTTLVDTIYGLRTPTAGSLMIDGVEPGDLRPDILRSRVVIARGTEVLHATIEENVHLHSQHITVNEIRETLAGVGLLGSVLRLPDGLDTMLSSGGSPLSRSQCRLLGLARAAVRRPGLLLVDCVLDGLSDDELDHVLDYLTAPERKWTLIVTTRRSDIADRLPRVVSLTGSHEFLATELSAGEHS